MGKYSVLEPYRLYDLEYRTKFEENSDKYFEEMVKESAVDVEANRKTVREIDVLKDDLKKLRKKLSGKKALKTFEPYNAVKFSRVSRQFFYYIMPFT